MYIYFIVFMLTFLGPNFNWRNPLIRQIHGVIRLSTLTKKIKRLELELELEIKMKESNREKRSLLKIRNQFYNRTFMLTYPRFFILSDLKFWAIFSELRCQNGRKPRMHPIA